MKCVSIYRFSDPEHANSHEKSWLAIRVYSNKINKFNLYVPCNLFPWHSLHVYWLTCRVASSPAFCAQVQENLLLLSSNIPPSLVKSICPDMSSQLLRYYDENIRHAHCSMLFISPEKYLGDNSSTVPWNTQCSRISDRTTVGFPQVSCLCQPCYCSESWLLRAGNHAIWLNCLSLKAWGSLDWWKQPSLILAALIPRNFSASYLNAGPVCSIALTNSSSVDVQRRQQNFTGFYQR
jgi:hypothetical protein